MKRLAWLLLAVFCTALVQIQPAQGSPAKVKSCACCPVPSSCGSTECCPPAAFAAVALGAEGIEQVTPAASRSERTTRSAALLLFSSLTEPEALRPALAASAEADASASVPLFKAHCCFLI